MFRIEHKFRRGFFGDGRSVLARQKVAQMGGLGFVLFCPWIAAHAEHMVHSQNIAQPEKPANPPATPSAAPSDQASIENKENPTAAEVVEIDASEISKLDQTESGEHASAQGNNTGGAESVAPTEPEIEPANDGSESLGDDLEADLGADLEAELGADLESLLAENVVAGASRSAESASEAPALVWSISGSQLANYGITDLTEAFNYLSLGMYAEDFDNGKVPGLGGRGLAFPEDDANHILLVIDGHFVNSPGGGNVYVNEWSALPIELIDRVEIILGPGSVLYGSNAMLGVINVITKRGKDIDGFRVVASGNYSPPQDPSGAPTGQQAENWGADRRLAARYGKGFSLGSKHGSVVAQAEFRHDRGIGYQYGPQYMPGLESLFDWGSGVEGDNPGIWYGRWQSRVRTFGGYGKLNIGEFQLSVRSARTGVTSPAFAAAFNDQNAVLAWGMHFADARYNFTITPKLGGMARIYGDYWNVASDITYSGLLSCSSRGAPVSPCRFHLKSEQWRAGGELQFSYNWLSDDRLVTMIGADARYRHSAVRTDPQATQAGTKFGTVGIVDHGDPVWAVYAQQIVRPTQKISLNAGLRYDRVGSDQAVSPRGAMMTAPWNGGTLKASYSQAFRAPTPQERFLNYPGYRIAPAELMPEKVQGVELIVGQALRSHRLTLAGFGSKWRDMIGAVVLPDPDRPGEMIGSQQNLSDIWNAGINAAWSVSSTSWDAGINLTYAWSRSIAEDLHEGEVPTDEHLLEHGLTRAAYDEHGRKQPLALAPSFFGNARVGYRFGEKLPTVATAVHVTSSRYIAGAYDSPAVVASYATGESDQVGWRVMSRTTVSGLVPSELFAGLRYRLSLDLNSNTDAAAMLGPFSVYQQGDGTTAPQLYQVPRASMFFELSYDF